MQFSSLTQCNFPLEYMFTSAKWNNHMTLKNTTEPFPTMGRKADILTCESSGDAVSFQNWCRQWLSSAQNQQGQKETGEI